MGVNDLAALLDGDGRWLALLTAPFTETSPPSPPETLNILMGTVSLSLSLGCLISDHLRTPHSPPPPTTATKRSRLLLRLPGLSPC